MLEIQPYFTSDGQIPFARWGDCKPCQNGVWELRIDLGPGYRVYYAQAGQTVVLLLCAGSKRTQQADIDRACEYWRDWQSRFSIPESAV